MDKTQTIRLSLLWVKNLPLEFLFMLLLNPQMLSLKFAPIEVSKLNLLYLNHKARIQNKIQDNMQPTSEQLNHAR